MVNPAEAVGERPYPGKSIEMHRNHVWKCAIWYIQHVWSNGLGCTNTMGGPCLPDCAQFNGPLMCCAMFWRLQKGDVRLQAEQIGAGIFVVGATALQLLSHGVDVAEAGLERAIREDRVRTCKGVRHVHYGRRFVRGVGGSQTYGDLLVQSQLASINNGIP